MRVMGALLLLLLFPSLGSATTIRSFSLSEMVQESAAVIQGKILNQTPRWKHDKSAIYTDSTIRVVKTYKGRVTQDTIVVRQLGGIIDGMEMSVVGTARLQAGENVVLFLRTNGKKYFLVGMAQGKYAVKTNGTRTIATRNVNGIHHIHKMQRLGTPRHHKHEDNSMLLSTLVAKIRAANKTQKVTP